MSDVSGGVEGGDSAVSDGGLSGAQKDDLCEGGERAADAACPVCNVRGFADRSGDDYAVWAGGHCL